MSETTPQLRDFAVRLMACETGGRTFSRATDPAAFLVVEKLRPKLATLMGDSGFRALLSRALARAELEIPSLRAVKVDADGSLAGLAELQAQADPRELAEVRVVLLAELLGLLVAFIGQDLTLRLAREVWPKLSFSDLDVRKRRQS